MTDWTQVHPTQPMQAPGGRTIDIDVEMVPLVAELWRLGHTTNLACQDAGEAILGGGTRTPEPERPAAAARNIGRAWLIVRAKEGPRLLEAWRPLRDSGRWLLQPAARDEPSGPWASLTFPRDRITDAAELLRRL
ncbi:hypothetical protein [Thermomonospora cellulosilytica]|uniref:Uncharacterized protein n=1 Tax=Thermomonospora cellulosilytica TaxID=1411118 RepID=A0A7W3RB99_9ACTN|nr:hypothetical protein [Thermomonospora cellulosilytica]MBA9007258.1 hypothetical protein [Thermomonospora cellulosilytica]